jgi:hypothetical protein
VVSAEHTTPAGIAVAVTQRFGVAEPGACVADRIPRRHRDRWGVQAMESADNRSKIRDGRLGACRRQVPLDGGQEVVRLDRLVNARGQADRGCVHGFEVGRQPDDLVHTIMKAMR